MHTNTTEINFREVSNSHKFVEQTHVLLQMRQRLKQAKILLKPICLNSSHQHCFFFCFFLHITTSDNNQKQSMQCTFWLWDLSCFFYFFACSIIFHYDVFKLSYFQNKWKDTLSHCSSSGFFFSMLKFSQVEKENVKLKIYTMHSVF